jgi:hypothetical protein
MRDDSRSSVTEHAALSWPRIVVPQADVKRIRPGVRFVAIAEVNRRITSSSRDGNMVNWTSILSFKNRHCYVTSVWSATEWQATFFKQTKERKTKIVPIIAALFAS